jgi:predicted RNA-binding Zn-ribbon protein involved in translation (DUF1610 family)
MSEARVTKVMFACPHCAAVYVATQQARADAGSFDCWDCRTEIFRWSGDYYYGDWDQIDAIQDIEWEACINKM